MKQEFGIWIMFVLAGVGALVAWRRDKNRKSLHRFILLFTGVFLIIFGLLFIVKELFGFSILQPDFLQWILFILMGIVALVVWQTEDKNRKSLDVSIDRFILLSCGIFLIALGLWFLVSRLLV